MAPPLPLDVWTYLEQLLGSLISLRIKLSLQVGESEEKQRKAEPQH